MKAQVILALQIAGFCNLVLSDTEVVDGIEWTYTIENGEASVGGEWMREEPCIPYLTEGAITIPSTLGNCPLTSIGEAAFYSCGRLTSITIPDGVTSIGKNAFIYCSGLRTITIGDGVTSIGSGAFNSCSGLASITIPDGVTSIGSGAFSDCRGLASITIPDSVTSIGEYAFWGCSGLMSITIPDSVTSIGSEAFRGCSGLMSVTIPDSVTSIGGGAFYGCSGLMSITIPDGVTSIGGWAFAGCSALKTIVVPASLQQQSSSWGVPSGCTVIYRNPGEVFLSVSSVHGTPVPNGEWIHCASNDVRACSVEAIATDVSAPGIQYLCTGWTGTGSVPTSGTGTNVTFMITEDSSLTWNWRTENQIVVSVAGCGECAFGTQWVADGATVTAEIVPNTHLYTIAMSGDTNGVTLAGTTLTIPSDGPRNIAVTVSEVKLALDVATAHGTATPVAGRTMWTWGESVAASVPATVEEGRARYACTGWTGMGSVPASGTAASATFTIEEDSSITWNWRKENQISVVLSGPGTCAFGTQWVADGATVTATIVPTVHLYDVSVFDDSGDVGGVLLDGTTLTIRADKPRMVMVQLTERKVALDVTTAHGTAAPSGRTQWSWGDAVAASVAADAPAGGVRYVCTGWTGTGSAPASGTATNVSFTIEEDSSLTWNWRKENQIAVSVAGCGSCAFGTNWVENGTTATATIVPTTHLYTIAMSGDTNGVTLAGTTLAIPSDGPRNIAVTVAEVNLVLDVATAHGTATPAAGRTSWSWGDTVEASVAADEAVDGVRWACTGWSGTGSAPTNGTAASATFTIEEDSTITWNWEKQNRIEVSVYGKGTSTFGTQWIADGATATATVVPTTTLFEITLVGDSEGVTVDGATISIPSDRPRTIGVSVEEVKLNLDVASAHGTAVPSGRTKWTHGDRVEASVREPEPSGGVRQVCTGWTGTGSAPASGTATNVAFTIEVDSSLTWNWRKENRIAVSVAGDGTCAFGTNWVENGTTATATIVPTTHLYTIAMSGDTNGVTLAGTTLAIPSDGPRNVAVTVTEVKLALDVSTAHGTATPAGRTSWSWGDTVEASVAADAPVDGVRWACTGWTGTGSAPTNGTTASVSFAIGEDSTLTWTWEKQNQITVMAAGEGTCAFGTRWIADGTNAEAVVVPSTPLYRIRLFGDADGATVEGTVVTIPSDRPRMIGITIEKVDLALTVSTAFGSASPAAGQSNWSWGDTVRASVAMPEPEGGVRQFCTGWTGTGSVPANGTGTNVAFVIEENSTLTWNWEEQVLVRFETTSDARPVDSAVANESLGELDARTSYTFSLSRNRIVPGSVSVRAGNVTFTDNGNGGLEASGTVASGNVNYATGAVSLRFSGMVPSGSVVASYRFSDDGNRIDSVWTARGDSVAEFAFTKPTGIFARALEGDTNGVVVDDERGVVAIPTDAPRSVRLSIHEITVDEAVRTGEPLAWTAGGTWFVCEDGTASGGYCLRSGRIGAGETSAFEATVEGAGTVSFAWRISSNRGHFAKFYLDGAETNSITRSTAWATLSFALGNGSHTLRWTYEKGTGATAGEDAAFLDDVRWEPLTLAEALDAEELGWTTDGDAPWIPQIAVSSDGADAAKSGAVVGESVSRLSTVVTNSGTLAWKWKADVAGSAGVEVYLDGEDLYDAGIYLEGTSDWADASLEIEGNGEHIVTFEYWNGGTAATISDCAYVDQVSWTPDKPEFVIVEGVKIPVTWLDGNAPAAVAAAGGDYEAAARAIAANGADKVWQCYLSGVSPTNATERFLAHIAVTNGTADVWWTPDLNEGGTKNERVYTVEGKTNLVDQSWGPTNEATRFFRVKVEMP